MIALARLANGSAGREQDLHGLDVAFTGRKQERGQAALAANQFAVTQRTFRRATSPATTARGGTTSATGTPCCSGRLWLLVSRRNSGRRRRIPALSALILA